MKKLLLSFMLISIGLQASQPSTPRAQIVPSDRPVEPKRTPVKVLKKLTRDCSTSEFLGEIGLIPLAASPLSGSATSGALTHESLASQGSDSDRLTPALLTPTMISFAQQMADWHKYEGKQSPFLPPS